MVANLRETETKYDAPANAALPGLEQLPQVAAVRGPEEQQFEAEYYDTDDLRLIRAGITLRRRSGGGDAGWHLKLPAGQTPAARSGGRSAMRRARYPASWRAWCGRTPETRRCVGSPDDHDPAAADSARPCGRIARRDRGRRRIRADAGRHHGTVPLAGGRGGAARRRPEPARGGRQTAAPRWAAPG